MKASVGLFSALCLMLATLPGLCLDRARFDELNKKARAAANQKDWKAMRAALLELAAEMPGPTPVYMLRMASVEARLGNSAEALHWMSLYASSGLAYDMGGDADLQPLASSPEYKSVASQMERAVKPISTAELVCSLPLDSLMPEDITFDRASRSFFVSSIQHHRLYQVSLPKKESKQCGLLEVPLESDATRWPVLAVSADPARNLLWMTAAALPDFAGFPPSDSGKTALFAIDKASGKIVRRWDLTAGGPAVLGDMCITKDGTVYVSDSIGGGVYRVRGDPKTAILEKIAGGFFSPQTPVPAADGRRLFVADYPMGIAVIDLHQIDSAPKVEGKLNYLPHPDNIAVTGLDGLYLSGNSLIGIQNGTEPERIMRYRLNHAQTAITSSEVVEQASGQLGDPTHAVLVDGMFYVSANVGWNKVDDHGQLMNGEHFTAPAILRFPAKK